MTDAEIERLAKGLTTGERRAIDAAVEHLGQLRIPTYAGRKTNGHRARVSLPTLNSLERKGLMLFHPPRLTDLGLAVRTHLKGQSHE